MTGFSAARLDFELLAERAAARYRSSGRYAWHFAGGKLRHDPFFRFFSTQRPVPDADTFLDLGCGQGLLFSLLASRRAHADASGLRFHGIEVRSERADVARRALGALARIDCCDIRSAEFPRASLITVIDVLLYMNPVEQERVLDRAVEALESGGTLWLREADRSAGFRFHVTEWTERLLGAARGGLAQGLHYRSAAAWRSALAARGLEVSAQPMSEGTPFSNSLYIARKN